MVYTLAKRIEKELEMFFVFTINLNNVGKIPFFLLVHWPPVFKHLNVSYTKSSSKWIWSENMVEPTLIKVSI
jgi:hypothetical protein